MIITKKALPRRTFLRGHGRDAGAAAAGRDGSVHDRPGRDAGRIRCAAWASSTCRWARTSPQWTPPGAGSARRAFAHPAVARAGDRSAHGHHQSGAEERLPRHACDLERRLPERRHSEVDGEHATTISAPRSTRSPPSRSARRRGCRRSNWRWICSPRWASATTATPASIRTISPGRRPPRRCRPKRIRAIVFERLFGDGGSAADRLAELRKSASLLDWVSEDIARLQKKLGPGDRTKVSQYLDTVREVERRIQKAEADDRRFAAARSRSSGRRAGGLCRSCAADVRSAGAGAAGRRHARDHVPAGARNQHPDLSGDRRARAAPSAHAPRRRSGEAREGGEDQRVPRVAVRRISWRS